MLVWVFLGGEICAHKNPQLNLALLRADTLSVFAQICAALGKADDSDAAGPSTSGASHGAGSAIPRSAQVAIVYHISHMLHTILAVMNNKHSPPLSELVAALRRSQLLEHLTGAIVRLSAALPPGVHGCGDPKATCSRLYILGQAPSAALDAEADWASLCLAVTVVFKTLVALACRGDAVDGFSCLAPVPHPVVAEAYPDEVLRAAQVRPLLSGRRVQWFLAWALRCACLGVAAAAGAAAAADAAGAAEGRGSPDLHTPQQGMRFLPLRLDSEPAALPAAGTPMAACACVVEAAAWVFQVTAGGPGHLPIAQPPVGYRPAAAPAGTSLPSAAAAASAGGDSARAAPSAVPYAAVAVYDMIAAAWTVLSSSCGGGGGSGGGGTRPRASILALRSRLLTELRPRQAAARLPGLWREGLAPHMPALVSADYDIRVGELLRLQVPAPPQAPAVAVAASDTPSSAGPSSYSSYSLRCALDAGLLPALERALRNEQAWLTGHGTDGSDSSSGASGKGSSPSPVGATRVLHEINCTLRFSGVWPAALAHAPPAQVVGLVATLTAAARRLQRAEHPVSVGIRRLAGHMTMGNQTKSDAFAELCTVLAALLEQGLDLAADASGAAGEDQSGALAPSDPTCPRRRRWFLRLNDALEPPFSAPMQLEWLAAAGGAPPAGSAAAVQRDWLLAFAVQQWLPLLLQYVGAGIRGIQERTKNAAGGAARVINNVLVGFLEVAVVVLRAAGQQLTAAALASVRTADKVTEAHQPHWDGASSYGAVAAASMAAAQLEALADSWQLQLLVSFLAQHTELWAHSGGSASTRCDGASRAGDADGRRPGGGHLQEGGDGGGGADADAAGLEGSVLDALEAFWLHRPQECANLMLSGVARCAAPGDRGSSSSGSSSSNSSIPSGGTQGAAHMRGRARLLPLRQVAARHGRSELVQFMEAASAAVDEAMDAVAATTAAAAPAGTKAEVCVDFKPPAAGTEQLQRLVRRQGAVGEAGSDGVARRRAWRMASPAEVQLQMRAALAAAAAAAAPSAATASSAGATARGSGGPGAAAAAAAVALCANPACSSLEGPSALVLAGRGKTCSRCREARYCCGVCQLQHWREGGHDSSCAGVVAATAGSGSAGRAAGDSAVGPASSGPGRGPWHTMAAAPIVLLGPSGTDKLMALL
ncbi:hypothetical protein HXX76_010839 [Chlamydomonas incerta]|uniref:phytol kinase n=1 Tax=Chlamydomonas incerta TaxID=51695 RepID=A0A835T125_CHLIN|nr:hypothetical protein HXX76_010839 [Chlamydomonas incerta]|eukprot:KAG2429606.1 hypothetical protein HXX76_010839 [Chlamydomonas incerta]